MHRFLALDYTSATLDRLHSQTSQVRLTQSLEAALFNLPGSFSSKLKTGNLHWMSACTKREDDAGTLKTGKTQLLSK